MKHGALVVALTAGMFATPALAATQVNWTTITGSVPAGGGGATTATGTMTVGTTSVGVTISADTYFVQTATSGSYYWTQGSPAPYTGGQYNTGSGNVAGEALNNAPGDNSLVAFANPTSVTVSFSRAVSNVYMALVSWNGDGIANFSSPYSLVSSGVGYFGDGYYSNVSTTGFTGVGELHGVIKFAGPITTLTFDVTGSEAWHGILFGTAGLAATAVPEPASWAMMILGAGVAGVMLRRRPRVATRVRFA